MSAETTRERTFLRSDRRTVTQLLAAAERDTDAVSVFMDGCTVADTEAAVFVVKGPEAIAYLRELCRRQGLLTDKSVEGGPRCNLRRPWEESPCPPLTVNLARADEENDRLRELADSEGTRAVEYLRRARKAEAEELRAAQENDELRAQLEAVRKACGEAVDAASSPRTMSACGLGAPIGGVTSPWDDGYKNGVQACATVVWAAMQPKRGEV